MIGAGRREFRHLVHSGTRAVGRPSGAGRIFMFSFFACLYYNDLSFLTRNSIVATAPQMQILLIKDNIVSTGVTLHYCDIERLLYISSSLPSSSDSHMIKSPSSLKTSARYFIFFDASGRL